jgi:3-oxoacyl-[acyl-carrier-protein] synthase-3
MGNVIVGTGSYLPEQVVTNDDIEAMGVDYDRTRSGGKSLDEWAREHHGGISRHKVAPGEATSQMATQASVRALADAHLEVSDIDLIVMSTITNDYRLPQSAGIVQANLGSKAKFIQVDSACSGFVDSLMVASSLMDTHGYETALVVGADTLTTFNDPKKFMPLTVFGDGAGAVVVQRQAGANGCGVKSFSTGSDGDLGDYVWVPGGASKNPFSQEVLENGLHYWRFKFPNIYTWAVERMTRCTLEAVAKAGLTLDDIKWVVPHQASVNIILDVARRLELPEEMFIITYPHTGNLSGASIPIALDEANSQAKFAEGDWLVMPAVGAGMAWAAATYCWYDYKSRQNGKSNGSSGEVK